MRITATRYHDFSCGHRVHNHESKCALLHGHNYRAHFFCDAPALDMVGRVIDFSVIKSTLCQFCEEYWDHKFLAWTQDPVMRAMVDTLSERWPPSGNLIFDSIVWVPFNPTAENMARHLLEIIGPALLAGTGVTLRKVIIEETRKCSAEVEL